MVCNILSDLCLVCAVTHAVQMSCPWSSQSTLPIAVEIFAAGRPASLPSLKTPQMTTFLFRKYYYKTEIITELVFSDQDSFTDQLW